MRFLLTRGGRREEAEIEEVPGSPGRFRVEVGSRSLEVECSLADGGPLALLIDGRSIVADVDSESGDTLVTVRGCTYRLRVEAPGRRAQERGRPGNAGQRLLAPMPGRVVAVGVQPGQPVEAGAPLVVLEAMKMENEFRSTVTGVVREVRVSAGQTVSAGDLMVVVDPPG